MVGRNNAAFDVNGDGRTDFVFELQKREYYCVFSGPIFNPRSMPRPLAEPAISTMRTEFDAFAPAEPGLDAGLDNSGQFECMRRGGRWVSQRYTTQEMFVSSGDMATPRLTANGTLGTASTEQMRPVDINGDGLSDIMYTLNGTWFYRISTGTYFRQGQSTWLSASNALSHRTHFVDINGDGRKHKIIYRDRDYHGTTIATLSSTGQEQRRAQYGPFVPGFSGFANCLCYRCPFGKSYGSCEMECAHDLETAILREGADEVGAVVLEPITAGGGVIPPPPEYFPIIQAICKKYDVLLHIDEVVCGLGRTGEWFGYQHYGVQPDMVTMAKGVASAYAAISCTVTTEALFNAFKSQPDDKLSYFRDISTFGGCTAGPVAGLETLAIIEEEGLLDNVRSQGAHLMERLEALKEKHPLVGDVRGKGLFAGIELVADRATKAPVDESVAMRIAAHTLGNGVMIGRTNRSFAEHNNTLCLSPALIATRRDIDDIVDAIDLALSEVAA